MTTVAVIGAGVTGLTTAYELLDRGFEVTVFDRHRYAAMETSFANGGQLSASNAETWTQWGTVLKGLKWMLQADAPLLVNPRPTLHKIAGWPSSSSQHPALPGQHRRDRPPRHRRPRRALRDGRARGHRLRPRDAAASCTSTAQKDLRPRPHGQRPAREGGLERRARRRPTRSAPSSRRCTATSYGGFLTESDARATSTSSPRGLARACARRGVTLRFGDRRRRRRRTARKAAYASRAGGAEDERFDGVVVSAGIRSREIAAAARRPGQRLPGEGLLDHRQSRRRRQPGGGPVDQPARRPRQDRHEPPRRGPLPRRRHRRVQRRQPRHPRRPHPPAGRLEREALPGDRRPSTPRPGPACAR